MRMEDLLWEVYRRKEAEISREEEKDRERVHREASNTPEFKQAAVQLGKLVVLVRQHGFKIKETSSTVNLDEVHIEAGNAETERKFREKREKLEKAFLDLKIALATAGKADQQSLIKNFAEAVF